MSNLGEKRKSLADQIYDHAKHHETRKIQVKFYGEQRPFRVLTNAFDQMPYLDQIQWLLKILTLITQARHSCTKARLDQLNRLFGYKWASDFAARKFRLVSGLAGVSEPLYCCYPLEEDGKYALFFSVHGAFPGVNELSQLLQSRFGIYCHYSLCGPEFVLVTAFPFK